MTCINDHRACLPGWRSDAACADALRILYAKSSGLPRRPHAHPLIRLYSGSDLPYGNDGPDPLVPEERQLALRVLGIYTWGRPHCRQPLHQARGNCSLCEYYAHGGKGLAVGAEKA